MDKVEDWRPEKGQLLWCGTIGGRQVRLLLLDDAGLALSVENLGLLALDIRDWWDAGMLYAALASNEDTDAELSQFEQEGKQWTRH